MIKNEAERIAAVVNLVRPEWRTGLIMTVLGDERIINRTYADVMVAFVAMAVDPTSKKPGRIHEPGRWWLTVSAAAPAPSYRQIGPDDCGICSLPKWKHPLSPTDDHSWESQHARGKGHAPTPEQRAEIDKAAAATRTAITAAKEAAEKKPDVASVDEVLARHTQEDA